jgi:sulfonate transport system substrate-binding protein
MTPVTLLCAAAALLAGLAGAPHTAAAAGELRIGLAYSTSAAPLMVARQKGWVEDELARAGRSDTVVRWFPFTAGPPVNEAMTAGQIDVGSMGDTPALIARSSGLETVLFGISSAGSRTQAMVVRTDSPVTSVKDLNGRKVAAAKGTTTHELLGLILAEAGLRFSDVEFINLPLSEMNVALEKSTIDAAVVWEPLLTRLEAQGTVRILRDATGLKNSVSVLVAMRPYAQTHPEEVRSVLRALRRGARLLADNPEEGARLVAADLRLPPELIQRSVSRHNLAQPLTPAITDDIRQSERFLRDNALIRRPVDVDAFIDPAFSRSVFSEPIR